MPCRKGRSQECASPSRQDQLATPLALGPVITLDRLDSTVPLARALVVDGVRLLEVALRTPAGLNGARAIMRMTRDAVVGTGTILTPDDLRRVVEASARFALSPGATPDLLAMAAVLVPFLPEVPTASELLAAPARGFTTPKFFPATAAGGMPALGAVAGPFAQARFCPTGGISEANATGWPVQPDVVAVGRFWLTPSSEVTAKR